MTTASPKWALTASSSVDLPAPMMASSATTGILGRDAGGEEEEEEERSAAQASSVIDDAAAPRLPRGVVRPERGTEEVAKEAAEEKDRAEEEPVVLARLSFRKGLVGEPTSFSSPARCAAVFAQPPPIASPAATAEAGMVVEQDFLWWGVAAEAGAASGAAWAARFSGAAVDLSYRSGLKARLPATRGVLAASNDIVVLLWYVWVNNSNAAGLGVGSVRQCALRGAFICASMRKQI